MKFIPKYTISYCGTIHKANVPFEIVAKDATKMEKYGLVEWPQDDSETEEPLEQKKKPGRPKQDN